MTEILGALLLLACLIGIFAIIFRGVGGNVGRPPKGMLTRLKDPSDAPYAASALSAYALGAAVAITDPVANIQSAIIIGLLIAVLVSIPAIHPYALAACGLVAVLLSLWEMARFVLGDGDYDALTSSYRILLMLLLFAFFALGVLVFGRGSAIRGERGFALFGLTEIVLFLASPSGRNVLNLDGLNHLAFLAIVCALAFALGWAVSEYVLGVVAIAVVVISVLQTAESQATAIGLAAALAAVGFLFAANLVRGMVRT